jgi:lactate 2-monooxygenase
VLIGRPYVYGLAIAGGDGVGQVVRNIVAELDLTLGLIGATSVSELGEDRLTPEPDSSATLPPFG